MVLATRSADVTNKSFLMTASGRDPIWWTDYLRGVARPSLERGRADLARRRVATALVIEHFDVVEQGFLGVGVAFEAFARQLFTVENPLSITALS